MSFLYDNIYHKLFLRWSKFTGISTYCVHKLLIGISGFKEGHEDIEDDTRSGCPSTARPITEKKIEEIGKVICKDHCFSIRAVA